MTGAVPTISEWARSRAGEVKRGARALWAGSELGPREAGDALGHHPRVSIGNGYVDLELVADDAIYRDDEGTEHVLEWVTQQDVDLARRITEIAVAVAAGGTVVDDSNSPSLTVIADQDGNKGTVCVDVSAAKRS
jgi:hypothetical protein